MGFRDILEIHQLFRDTLGISMGKWKLVCSHKNLASKESTSTHATAATTQICNSLGWLNWTMPHLMGQNFMELKLYPVPVHSLLAQYSPKHIATGKLDSKNRCYSLAFCWNDHESQGNWTWTSVTKSASKQCLYSSSPSWQAWALRELNQGFLQVTLWWV